MRGREANASASSPAAHGESLRLTFTSRAIVLENNGIRTLGVDPTDSKEQQIFTTYDRTAYMKEQELPEALVVHSTPIWGPVKFGDPELLLLLAELIAHISSASVNLQNFAIKTTDERTAARRLTALTALLSAGELRAILALCTMGLAMESRIHLRTLDDCLRRIAVYWSDADFATTIATTIEHYQAEGIKKLDADDRARHAAADEAFGARYDSLVAGAQKPAWITDHPKYEKHPVGLDSFTRWAYSQVEHASPIALVEISHRVSLEVDATYATDDVVSICVTSVGIALSIIAFLASWGFENLRNQYVILESRLEALLKRSGLDVDEPAVTPKGHTPAEL